MLASNLLVRLSLLVVLCLGAFYYLVTVMDQQQQQIAGGPSGTAGSNWLADNGTTPNARPRRATSIRGSAIPIRDMPTSTSARSGIDAIVSNWANEVSGIITADSGTSSLVSIATTGHESEDSWTMTTTLASDIIYALIRSTNAAMFLTCDSERPCSAPTAPTIPQITLFKPHQQHDQEPGEKKKGIASNFEHSQLQEHKRDKGFGDNNSNRQDNKGKMKARLEEGEENQSLIVPTFDHQALRGFQYRIRSYPQSESAGESSRSSSRRPSVAYPATLPIALTTRGSPLPALNSTCTEDLSFRIHFYNIDALRSILGCRHGIERRCFLKRERVKRPHDGCQKGITRRCRYLSSNRRMRARAARLDRT